MKVPISWLEDYVDITLPVEELAERLTLAGLEVESVDVLSYDRAAFAQTLQLCQRSVAFVGLCIPQYRVSDVSEETPIVRRVMQEVVDVGVFVRIVFVP